MRALRFVHALALCSIVLGCGGKTNDGGGDVTDGSVHCDACPDTDQGGDQGDTTPTVDTAHDAVTDATPGSVPPSRPSVASAGGTTKWFVIRRLYLALSNRSTGKPSPNAWQDYGYDLDSRTTTIDDSKSSTNSCHRIAGSPTGALVDGHDGRDNNWGSHVVQTLKSLKSDVEDAANLGIVDGGQTILLRIDNVVGDDNATVPGAIYLSGPLGSTPHFDGSDVYPVDASSVSGGDLTKPIRTFPGGYMSGGVWVSGDLGTSAFEVPIAIANIPLTLPMQGGVLVFRVADGTQGTIAGLMRTSDFDPTFRPLMERFGICPGNATYDQVVVTFTQSADLVTGAPQFQDTSRDCDSISIGMGFDAAPVQPPTTITPPPPPPPSDCAG